MSPNRLTNHAAPDQAAVAGLLERFETVHLQYSAPPAPETLPILDHLAEVFGERVEVRFFAGSRYDPLDARIVGRLPSVRNLAIDTDSVSNLEAIGDLENLVQLRIGAYEGTPNDILHAPNLSRLSSLNIGGLKTKRIDLAPIAGMNQLKALGLAGQATGLSEVVHARAMETLWLHGLPHTVGLGFVRDMPALKKLGVGFGSRTSLDEVGHSTLRELFVLRVRGLQSLPLSAFPALELLAIEDQLQLDVIDIGDCGRLRKLWIMTCKGLTRLDGVERASSLEEVAVGITGLDLEQLARRLPIDRLKRLGLSTGKVGADRVLKAKLAELGAGELQVPRSPWL